MDITQPLQLLGGLTAQQFMKRHWQKKPLLVREAMPIPMSEPDRAQLFALVARDEVESRLVTRDARGWQLRHGPFARRALPPRSRPGWTLLVQGVDLHLDGIHELLHCFRFVPEARLDDVMISYATDGGGVGPHVDSYDVFLLQAQGRRRWRFGLQKDLTLQETAPLKILVNFVPAEEYLLEAGDMLYLPPGYAHDGVAEGECQTWSIGFRSPGRGEIARELLQRLAEDAVDVNTDRLYRDRGHPATATPGAIPPGLQRFAADAIRAALKKPLVLERALGEYLTEPKANVWFETRPAAGVLRSAVLDRRTRMMHDMRHIFINGESWRAAGHDAAALRKLADQRCLSALDCSRLSDAAQAQLQAWCEAGWLHDTGGGDGRIV